MVAYRIVRNLLLESKATTQVSLLLLIPLCKLVAIFGLDRLLVDHILSTKIKEFLIIGIGHDLELIWVPCLSINLFQVMLSWLEGVIVDGSAWLANEDSVRQLEVSRLILHAVDAVRVVWIISDALLQVSL